jgi:hypothetical protein
MVEMIYRLYIEKDASKFMFSLIPLIYYRTGEGSTSDLAEILSTNLTKSIVGVKNTKPRNFPNFHMSLYLLDIMCVVHQYPKMGWAWILKNLAIHIYSKVL